MNERPPASSSAGYDPHFFQALRQGSYESAQVIVPIVLGWLHPQSVVDVGCGDGTWLSVFQAHGVGTILGIDGDYVDRTDLQIPRECFTAANLQQPLTLDRTFDLVVSLEVAEHLPGYYADQFVASLSQLGDVVLFSAAIPHQGGTFHVNEQWPSYWVDRFEKQGYVAIDALRELIWENPQVEPWYAQNCLVFVKGDRLAEYPALQAQVKSQPLLPLVHPKIYLSKCPEPLPLTKAIEIVAVALLPAATLKSGDALAIAVDVQWHRADETALIDISLTNEEEQVYFKSHLPIHGPKIAGQLAPVCLDIERLDLAPGNYFVNVGIYTPDWQVTHDFHWHLYALSVQGDPQGGLIQPPIAWNVST